MDAARDEAWMEEAVALADGGVGRTYPNPCVGAVVVAGGRKVAAARTGPAGTAHAEVRALRRARGAARGAVLYVTLEPCAHHGRTPPCTRAILEAGVARVVVGVTDPDPCVRGRGIRALRRAGVEVAVGVARRSCAQLHEAYLHHVRTGRPLVTLKSAVSIDGRIAAPTGDSRWITGKPARTHAHRQRARHHAILVGGGTVRTDDPALTVRHVPGVDPIPVVLDSDAALASRPYAVLRPGTLVFHRPGVGARRRSALRRRGCVPLEVPEGPGGLDLAAVLGRLGSLHVRSVLVEGGARVSAAFVEAGLVDRWLVYRAPIALGAGRSVLEGAGVPAVGDAARFRLVDTRRLGPDLLCTYEPVRRGRHGGAAAGCRV